jgi:protein-arginine kinase activator protein McsA
MIQKLDYDVMISVHDYFVDDIKNSSSSVWCNNCNNKLAEIFQDEGNYCTECWQSRTHPNL